MKGCSFRFLTAGAFSASLIIMFLLGAVSISNAAPPAPDRVLVQGTVTDATGAVLTTARIALHWDPSGANAGLKTNVGLPEDRFTKTDTHGIFYAEIPPGFYDFFVTAPGYTPNCRKIRLMPNQNATFDTKLTPDPLVAKEVPAPKP
jgi:hypothetical protein